MNWAYNDQNKAILAVDQAELACSSLQGFTCPRCWNLVSFIFVCNGTSYFRHTRGNNDEACDLYTQINTPHSWVAPPAKEPVPWDPWIQEENTDILSSAHASANTDGDDNRVSASLIHGDVNIAMDHETLKVYVKEPPSEIDLSYLADTLASPMENAVRLASDIRRQGYAVGVYEPFDDAYPLARWAEAGDRVLLLGPVHNIDRQAGELRSHFRSVNRSQAVQVRYGVSMGGLPPLRGLPTEWALLTVTLPIDFKAVDLAWIRAAPFTLIGGWTWRRKRYWPDAPPTIVRASLGDWEDEWIVRRDGELIVNGFDCRGKVLPADCLHAPGEYRIWTSGSRYSIRFFVGEPEWHPVDWLRLPSVADGWRWGVDWPRVEILAPDDGDSTDPRVYGPWPLGIFPDTPEVAARTLPPPHGPAWYFLRHEAGCSFSTPSGRPGVPNAAHSLTRWIRAQ